MAMQIVMDRTGDSRHHFDPNDAQEVAKAERRFYDLTKVASPPQRGPVRVRSRRSDRSIRTRKKPCSFPGWLAADRAAPCCVSGRLARVNARAGVP